MAFKVESAFKSNSATPMMRPNVFWCIGEEIPQSLATTLMVLSVLLPVAFWWIVSSSGLVQPQYLLPTPLQTLAALQRLWADGSLQKDTIYSVARVLAGFALATILAIPVGTLMGSFASIRALLEPIIGLVRYMPASAFIPLLILYLGLDEAPKIVLIFIGTLFFNTLMIMDAAKFIPKELIETSYTLGGRRLQVLLQVIFPYILPNIIDICRVNFAAAWNLVIVSELIAATEGLGRRISVAQRFSKIDEIFAGLIVIGLIGLTLDLGCRLLLRMTCHWAEK